MSDSGQDYIPPENSVISENQNSRKALRFLLAQRKLYSQSKRWLAFRWLGMLVIAVVAPIVAVFVPSVSVGVGAVAGVWLFLARTPLIRLEEKMMARAASIQEQFDFTVFGMPSSGRRSSLPSLEEISKLAGPDEDIIAEAEKEELLDWYPLEADQSGVTAVAISQRANASYSDSLLSTTARVWLVSLIAWVALLVVLSLSLQLSLAQFLLGVAAPVLPAFLDIWQYWRDYRKAAVDRKDLVSTIEGSLREIQDTGDADRLLVWQERLFELRRSGPQVPDFIYKLKRKSNEAAMTSAAAQLADTTNEENE